MEHGEVDPAVQEKYEELVRFLHALADDRDDHAPECVSLPMCIGEIGLRAASATIYSQSVSPLMLALTGASEISRLRGELITALTDLDARRGMIRDAGAALESAEAQYEQEAAALRAQVATLEVDLGAALAQLTAYEDSADGVIE